MDQLAKSEIQARIEKMLEDVKNKITKIRSADLNEQATDNEKGAMATYKRVLKLFKDFK